MEEQRQEEEAARNEMMNRLTALEMGVRSESGSVRAAVEQLRQGVEEGRKVVESLRALVLEVRGNVTTLTKAGHQGGHSGGGDGVWNKLAHTVEADYLWRIEGWSKKLRRMADEEIDEIKSSRFYAHGYRFRLVLSKRKKADTIRVYCRIVEGDYDDNLSWPMRHPVTVSIMNQRALSTHKASSWDYATLPNSDAFDRPNGYDDDDIGPFRFQYYTVKQNPSVIVDDAVVVCCVLGGLPQPPSIDSTPVTPLTPMDTFLRSNSGYILVAVCAVILWNIYPHLVGL